MAQTVLEKESAFFNQTLYLTVGGLSAITTSTTAITMDDYYSKYNNVYYRNNNPFIKSPYKEYGLTNLLYKDDYVNRYYNSNQCIPTFQDLYNMLIFTNRYKYDVDNNNIIVYENRTVASITYKYIHFKIPMIKCIEYKEFETVYGKNLSVNLIEGDDVEYAWLLTRNISAETNVYEDGSDETTTNTATVAKLKIESENRLVITESVISLDTPTQRAFDYGFMVLPTDAPKYDVRFKTSLYYNGLKWKNFNGKIVYTNGIEDVGETGLPNVLIELTPDNGNVNYLDEEFNCFVEYFGVALKDNDNNLVAKINTFRKPINNEDNIKIYSKDSEDFYLVFEKHPCLFTEYDYDKGCYKLSIDPSIISWYSGEEIIINVDVYIRNETDEQTPLENTFSLPIIYKPFYTKRLYSLSICKSIQEGGDDGPVTTWLYYRYNSDISVYNGIGILAAQKIKYYNSSYNSGLKNKLTNYFNNVKYYNTYRKYNSIKTTRDFYAICLIDDSIRSNDYENDFYNTISAYRNRPLILCDYNGSVCDYFRNNYNLSSDTVYYSEIKEMPRNFSVHQGTISVNPSFNNKNKKFNKESHNGHNLNFGNINVSDIVIMRKTLKREVGEVATTTSTNQYKIFINNNSKTAITNANKEHCRYYVVNDQFIKNYVDKKSDFSTYCSKYMSNREYYDLFTNEITFNDNEWDDANYSGSTINVMVSAIQTKIHNITGRTRLSFERTPHGMLGNKNSSKFEIVEVNHIDETTYYVQHNVTSVADGSEWRKYNILFDIKNLSKIDIVVRVQLYDVQHLISFKETFDNLYETFTIKPESTQTIRTEGYHWTRGGTAESISIFVEASDGKSLIEYAMTDIKFNRAAEYLPFFDMLPSLKNTYGFEYSHSENGIINHMTPMAFEVNAETSNISILTNRGGEYSYNGELDGFFRYKNSGDTDETFYLVSVYSTLTNLSDNDYIKQIKNGNIIIPQTDSYTYILNYGKIQTLNLTNTVKYNRFELEDNDWTTSLPQHPL